MLVDAAVVDGVVSAVVVTLDVEVDDTVLLRRDVVPYPTLSTGVVTGCTSDDDLTQSSSSSSPDKHRGPSPDLSQSSPSLRRLEFDLVNQQHHT